MDKYRTENQVKGRDSQDRGGQDKLLAICGEILILGFHLKFLLRILFRKNSDISTIKASSSENETLKLSVSYKSATPS